MHSWLRNIVTTVSTFTRRQSVIGLCLAAVVVLLAPGAARLLQPAGSVNRGSAGVAIADDPVCGNGIVEPGEQCDDGPAWTNDCCQMNCQFAGEGSYCSDGNACNDPDSCDNAGHCVGQTPLDICPESQCQYAVACDPQVGCVNPPKPDGTVCDDGDACSVGDQCVGGACVGNWPTCGDGIVQSCELCDDGNTKNGDGCSSHCKLELGPQMCQSSIVQAGAGLMRWRLQWLQGCRNTLTKGKTLYFDKERTQPLTDPADCPNEFFIARRLLLMGSTRSRSVHSWCTDARLGLLAACAGTADGLITVGGDDGCLVGTHAAGADAMLTQEYGQVSPSDTPLQACQRAVAKAGMGYAVSSLAGLQNCRKQLLRSVKLFYDASKTQRLTDPADCVNEFNTASRIASAGRQARTAVAGGSPVRCTDTLVSSLGLCATTVDGLVSPDGSGGCLLTGHAAQVDALIQAEF